MSSSTSKEGFADISWCPHVAELDQDKLSRAQDELDQHHNGITLECQACKKRGQNLWICLYVDCCKVFCADVLPNHAFRHYQVDTNHCLQMNVTDYRLWCHECELELTAGEDVENSSISQYDTRRDIRPRGVTGLPNLGNTCYINSALQALVNTNPLVHYFSTRTVQEVQQGRGRRDGTNGGVATSLSAAFHRLVQCMSSKTEPPPQLLYTIRCAHPMFRGFQQHDSQEFLRCLMDQLHEEMKIPTYEPTQNRMGYDNEDSDDRESSEEGEEYETCDSGVSERSSLSEDLNQIKPVSISLSRASTPEQLSRRKSHTVLNQPGTPSKSKKVHYKSIISDIFDGTLLSSVQCLTCNRVSTRVETFQDLSLPIPSRDHLNLLHQSPSQGQPKCSHLYARQQGWYAWLWDWLCSWIWGPSVSLHDCLSAFFSADELKGDNMYSCGKCNKLRNGVKYSKVLKTPEVLCIHLKRFRHDLVFSSKIANHIKFPMEGLDLKPYLHEDCQGGVSKYNLVSVICHHGASGSGGHYTCYAFNSTTNQWYHYDDLTVTKVSRQTVNSCQAYVLFYRKDPMNAIRWRKRFHFIEEVEPAEEKNLLVSTDWLSKFDSFSWPGPIDNRDLIDCECQSRCSASGTSISSVGASSRVSQKGWAFLLGMFGGGPKVQAREDYSPCCHEQYNNQIFAVRMSWLNDWKAYMNGLTTVSPGPIDNTNLTPAEACGVTRKQWQFLVRMHGGGPAIPLSDGLPLNPRAAGDEGETPMECLESMVGPSVPLQNGGVPWVAVPWPPSPNTSPSINKQQHLPEHMADTPATDQDDENW